MYKVGSRFAPRLLQRGDAVRVLVRQAERAEFLRQRSAEVVIGDLLQPDTLVQAVAGVEAVIHLAAFFQEATAEEAQAVNQAGTLALAKAGLQADVRCFVFVSTNLVYGPGRGRPAREDDSPQPSHAYKAAAEQTLLEFYRTRGLKLRLMRLAFVYGEGDSHLTERGIFPIIQDNVRARQLRHVRPLSLAVAVQVLMVFGHLSYSSSCLAPTF